MSAPQFELSIDALESERLLVLALRGREEVNRPYRFDLLVESPAHDLEERACGEAATLRLIAPPQPDGTPGEARVLHGLVSRIRIDRYVEGSGTTLYAVRVASPLAALGLSQNSRIFQELSVPEIVDAVLAPRGIQRDWRVTRSYPKRDYRVQYAESDLAFVTRLLAEEGIHYFLAPGDDGDRVVLGDIPEHVLPLGAPLAYTARDDKGVAREGVNAFTLQRALRSEEARLTGFDYLRPAERLEGAADLSDLAADAKERPRDAARRMYDHARDWDAFRVSDESARVHLEQHRRRARLAEGSASTTRLFPGVSFALADHPNAALNRGFTVLRVIHEGKQAAGADGEAPIYACRFQAAPSGVAPRPKRPKRVLRQLLDTATVVGPAGEEIHVDEHGRVKVQFHWDRDGRGDDKSSCWIRAVAPWAGATWGFQFVPRVGMEVIVGCLGGDPDRPIILGAAFNGTHLPPYALPGHKTVSGIRTQSSPGPSGYNELRFEDAAGREQVLLRAERDLEEAVGHDHLRRVGHDERIEVAHTRTIDVEGDNIRTVKGNEIVTVEKNFVLHVLGRQRIVIEGGGAGGPEQGGPEASQADAPAGPEQALEKGAGQPAASAAATAALAKVNFLIEGLSDASYDHGEKLRELASAQKGAAEEIFEESAEAREHYQRILAEAPTPGDALPPGAVERAAMLRTRAGLVARGAQALVDALESTLGEEIPADPADLGKAQAAVKELAQALLPAVKSAKQGAALVEQMAGTIVESNGAVAPVPRLGGKGLGGGGGDNAFTEIDKGSEMTIKGKGQINAKDGLKIVAGASELEITNDGITLKAPKITLDATGTVDVKGHPIQLNC